MNLSYYSRIYIYKKYQKTEVKSEGGIEKFYSGYIHLCGYGCGF